jgi:hypothetical protein
MHIKTSKEARFHAHCGLCAIEFVGNQVIIRSVNAEHNRVAGLQPDGIC